MNREQLAKLNWTRKPTSTSEVQAKIPSSHPAIAGLQHFNTAEHFNLWRLADGTPQYFTVRTPEGSFLVNTEGYSYPRYMIRLVGLACPCCGRPSNDIGPCENCSDEDGAR